MTRALGYAALLAWLGFTLLMLAEASVQRCGGQATFAAVLSVAFCLIAARENDR